MKKSTSPIQQLHKRNKLVYFKNFKILWLEDLLIALLKIENKMKLYILLKIQVLKI
jgi:hypothetical protein